MINLATFKRLLLPSGTRPTRILLGPFRGATICMVPQENLRKVFGFYEHELNGWIERVLPQVDTVLDVGANDGYFTFGGGLRRSPGPRGPHYESPRRDWSRMDFYGWRNNVLFAWHNVPWTRLPWALCAVVLSALRHALGWGARPGPCFRVFARVS